MLKRISLTSFALLLTCALAAGVAAHPALKSANPPAGGTAAAPAELRLSFNEGVLPKLSSVEVKNRVGAKVATGRLATDPKDSKQLVVPLQAPLAAGTYTVSWSVVSVDTHRVKGTYSFKVDR